MSSWDWCLRQHKTNIPDILKPSLDLSFKVFSGAETTVEYRPSYRDSLVRDAYSEQRYLKLAWYNKRTELRQTIQDSEIWEAQRKTNRKLGYYNSIKETFGCETYLNIGLSY